MFFGDLASSVSNFQCDDSLNSWASWSAEPSEFGVWSVVTLVSSLLSSPFSSLRSLLSSLFSLLDSVVVLVWVGGAAFALSISIAIKQMHFRLPQISKWPWFREGAVELHVVHETWLAPSLSTSLSPTPGTPLSSCRFLNPPCLSRYEMIAGHEGTGDQVNARGIRFR